MKDLLNNLMYALNKIPNQRDVGMSGESTYELASQIGQLLPVVEDKLTLVMAESELKVGMKVRLYCREPQKQSLYYTKGKWYDGQVVNRTSAYVHGGIYESIKFTKDNNKSGHIQWENPQFYIFK